MVDIKDRLAQLNGGIARIHTDDGTDFQLKPGQRIKRELLFNYKQVTELSAILEQKTKLNTLTDEYLNTHNTRQKKLHQEQNDLILEVLKKSYPEWEKDQDTLDAIMSQYDDTLLTELYMVWGWVDKDVVNAMKKKKLQELKKLNGEEEDNPQNELQNKSDKSSLKDNKEKKTQ